MKRSTTRDDKISEMGISVPKFPFDTDGSIAVLPNSASCKRGVALFSGH